MAGPLPSPCASPHLPFPGGCACALWFSQNMASLGPGTWEGSLQGQEEKRAFSSENRFLSKSQAWELGWSRVKTNFLALLRPKGVSLSTEAVPQPLHSDFQMQR